MDCSYLRGSFHSLKLGASTLVCPPLTKILQTVLVDKHKSVVANSLTLEQVSKLKEMYLCALKLVTVNKPGAHHSTCASCQTEQSRGQMTVCMIHNTPR